MYKITHERKLKTQINKSKMFEKSNTLCIILTSRIGESYGDLRGLSFNPN